MSIGRSELITLRDAANSEHQHVLSAARDLIAHAVAAGEALNAARELVPYGEWMKWLEREFAGSVSQANFYRRLALNAGLIRASGARTLREAERYLYDHAAATTAVPRTGGAIEARRNEIVSLRREGKSAEEVAEIIGVSTSTVYNLSRKDWRRLQRRRSERSRAAMQALERQERERQAKRIGGDVAEAYSLVRRAAQTIERAMEQADDRAARAHLGRALDRLYRSEDEISRAIRMADTSTNNKSRRKK